MLETVPVYYKIVFNLVVIDLNTRGGYRKNKIKALMFFFSGLLQNVGKALRFSWRCLVTGLQSMASVYSTPLSSVATVVTNVHQASGSKT